MTTAFLVDFDGTVAETDASYAVLDRFGESGWRLVEDEALAYRITLLDALRKQAAMIKAAPREAEIFLKENVKMREGFRGFSDWCRENDHHLEICSDGFGWTIGVLLEHWDLEWIPWTSNTTIPGEKGWEISFPYLRDECPLNANCKCSHLERLKDANERVIFIGDGITDECVSKKADVVFARDRLLETCRKEGRDCLPWDNWNEVLERIKDLV